MDIQIFIPLIIFFFFIFIIRKVLKQIFSSQTTTVKESPWKQVLGDLVTQIKEEIEASKQEKNDKDRKSKPKRKPGWLKKQPLRPKAEQKDFKGFETPPPLINHITPEKQTMASYAKPLPEPPTLPPAPEISPLKKPGKKVAISELQKAVVWSEILAPPLALRKRD